LPVPLSPRNSTDTSACAARLVTSSTERMAGAAVPRSTSGASERSWVSRSATRMDSDRCATTLSSTWRICAGVNGLGR
jgi:hypothetical protein